MQKIIDLGDGLILSQIMDDQDAEQYRNLHQTFTGEGNICDRLIHVYPDVTMENFFVVKEQKSNRVVSTTCLLPWVVNFAGISLNAAMLEMVISHPDFRHKGLVRSQVKNFQRLVIEQGFDFSIIQGIPNYYRQFGYGYTLDHERAIVLPSRAIPDHEMASELTFRMPVLDDFPKMTDLYKSVMAQQQIVVQRSQAMWEYMVNAMKIPLLIIERSGDRQFLGYITCEQRDCVLYVRECGTISSEIIPAVFARLKKEYPGEVQVSGNSADFAFGYIESLGGMAFTPDQWLINIPDPRKFITKIGPILEKRLLEAGFTQLTQDVLINFYRKAVCLHFVECKLIRVDDVGFVDASLGAKENSDLCITPDAFLRLIFGYRTIRNLQDAWPDVIAGSKKRQLIDILFPPMSALILTPY